MPIHTTNFEAVKEFNNTRTSSAPACKIWTLYLECDSSIKQVGSVHYQIPNGTKHVITFNSTHIPDAACRYSSSELELSGLKKS